MMKKEEYNNFSELSKNETKDVDFKIEVKNRNAKVSVIAVHGRKIEFCTDTLARMIAGDDHNYYAFVAIRSNTKAKSLHITSHKFDEPSCLSLISKSEIVVAIHGCMDIPKNACEIHLGGRNEGLINNLNSCLTEKGFTVFTGKESRFKGITTTNICNRGANNMGAQIEISKSLRRSFKNSPKLRNSFIHSVREAIGRTFN